MNFRNKKKICATLACAAALVASLGIAGCAGSSTAASSASASAEAAASSAEASAVTSAAADATTDTASAPTAVSAGTTPVADEQPAGSGDIPQEDKVKAKAVIKSASNVFAVTESIKLTNEDSPASISSTDDTYKAFFEELKSYKGMEGVNLEDCTFDIYIFKVKAETAREDSQQINYRYVPHAADMTIDGKHITWDEKTGFTEA